MKYFKLIDAVGFRQKITVPQKINGTTYYKFVSLDPGEQYVLPEDEAFQKAVLNKTVESKLTPELEKTLESYHVDYTVKTCPSCGGRVKKAVYKICEVVEDA